MRAPGHVGEGLVDGDALDSRREVAQDSDRRVAESLVFVKVSADKDKIRTQLPRAPSRHAASYAEGTRLVGGREHDAASHRNRLAAQTRVEQLFDRRIKRVEVGVENGGQLAERRHGATPYHIRLSFANRARNDSVRAVRGIECSRLANRNARNLGAIALVSPVTGLVLTVDTKTL